MKQHQQVIAGHRIEGEPQTMARVQGMCEERWPHRSSIQWITSTDTGPRRHVAVTFARDRFRVPRARWLKAMDRVDAERQRHRIGH